MFPFFHLKETRQRYIPHFKFALTAGMKLIYAGITSIIHAFIPDAFPFTAERINKRLSEESNERQRERETKQVR